MMHRQMSRRVRPDAARGVSTGWPVESAEGSPAGVFSGARELIGPGQWGRWAVVVLFAVLASAFEAVGALLVYVLLQLIVGEGGTGALPVLGDLGTLARGMEHRTMLLTAGIGIAVFFAIRSTFVLVQHYVQYRVVERSGARLSTRLLVGYLGMPAEFHLQRNSAELIRNAFESVRLFLDEGLVPGVKLITKVAIVTGMVGVLLVTSPVATVVAIILLGSMAWGIMRFVQPWIKRLGRATQSMTGLNLKILQQSLEGWREIKALGREGYFVSRFAEDRLELARSRYLRRTAAQIPKVGLETAIVGFVAALLAAAVVVEDGAVQAIPVLGLFAYAAGRMIPELTQITQSLNSLKYAAPAIEDLRADLQLFRDQPADPTADVHPMPLRESIRLVDVSYRYPGAATDALQGVDVEIRRGQSVGIVGPTGGGKSTIIDILLGMLEPTIGSLLVDGTDVRGHARAWQATIGLVPQALFLTDDTIRRNIALGVPDDQIDDEGVRLAAELAQLDQLLVNLPLGLETPIGERGARLSGGERQRVAIARALYRRPAVLLFDEGTSALDVETEAALMASVEALRGDRTLVTVAHRLSTVRGCDQVFVVRDGRVVDRGTYAELELRHDALKSVLGAST